jgi:hypothetical protein
MCSRNDTEHLQPEPPAPKPYDPLWPNGTRPPCTLCHERPVYLAGLCGTCYAAEGERRRAELDARAAAVLAGALEEHRRAGL